MNGKSGAQTVNSGKMADCFIMYSENNISGTVNTLRNIPLCGDIYLICPEKEDRKQVREDCRLIECDSFWSIRTMRRIAEASEAEYTLIYISAESMEISVTELERMINIARDTSAGLTFSDYYIREENKSYRKNPVIDYRRGSLRDDFNFGALLLYRTSTLKKSVDGMGKHKYKYSGLYELRLKTSRTAPIVHINEYLYSVDEKSRTAGERQFDYVDPKNRDVQTEMEAACTAHLKATGAYLPPRLKTVDLNRESFDCEASVIIPVRNRKATILDAVRSAAGQKADFRFNVIVVDNYSTDGTTEAIDSMANGDKGNIIHIIPQRTDLGIGGCWNEAISHPRCGKFAVQLDSDDVYADECCLARIVSKFYEKNCPMVVGSYRLTDINWNTIPPDLIDHREWTDENGHNNALRINGLGAPRAFYTPLLRKIKLPNTSYGEDYAVGLRISREYTIGRIYEPVYLCRRWDGNSDSSIAIEKANEYNAYKDSIRTWEIEARIQINQHIS